MNKLLQEYYKLFPDARIFPEWFELSDKLKIEVKLRYLKSMKKK